jgi:tRNA (guanine37-N1)-methyltransferase
MEEKFDRILMPSPYLAESFIPSVRGRVKEGGYVHYYTLAGVEETGLPMKVAKLFREHGIEVEVENHRACGNYAPYVNRYVIDLRVLKGD